MYDKSLALSRNYAVLYMPNLYVQQIPNEEREARMLGPVLEKILIELRSKKHEDFHFFAQPVSEKQEVGYKKAVKRPMVCKPAKCFRFCVTTYVKGSCATVKISRIFGQWPPG